MGVGKVLLRAHIHAFTNMDNIDLPSVSSHAYSNTAQPNTTMEDPQGDTQAQPLSHFFWLTGTFLFFSEEIGS